WATRLEQQHCARPKRQAQKVTPPGLRRQRRIVSVHAGPMLMDNLMPTLPTRRLGRTDLNVSRLGYGAMEIRGPRIWGGREVTDPQAQCILEAVLDSGITFLDTSNDYGRSEAYIGQFLASRRNEFRLAT